MLTKRHILSAIVAATLSCSAVSAHAQNWNGQVVKEAQRSISASEAKSIALKRVQGGEFVEIRREGNLYRVRVIATDGQVVDVYIDVNTGRVKK